MARNTTRREFLVSGTSLATAAALGTILSPSHARGADDDYEISPTEDLMREHGVLKRVLLIYDEIGCRLRDGREFPPSALLGAARVIRDFVEDYHEKLEEDMLFPRFEKAGRLVDLVSELRLQHQRGRTLTDRIVSLGAHRKAEDHLSRQDLVEALGAFNRMYAVHEAREDTVLFPALRKLMSENEYAAMGEQFEKKEHELFGGDGFERYVDTVADIERSLGIYDLSLFTPKL